jgi:hypothetical protein
MFVAKGVVFFTSPERGTKAERIRGEHMKVLCESYTLIFILTSFAMIYVCTVGSK